MHRRLYCHLLKVKILEILNRHLRNQPGNFKESAGNRTKPPKKTAQFAIRA